jgi:hypothetical protein
MLRVADPPHILEPSPVQGLLQLESSANFLAPLMSWIALPHLSYVSILDPRETKPMTALTSTPDRTRHQQT